MIFVVLFYLFFFLARPVNNVSGGCHRHGTSSYDCESTGQPADNQLPNSISNPANWASNQVEIMCSIFGSEIQWPWPLWSHMQQLAPPSAAVIVNWANISGCYCGCCSAMQVLWPSPVLYVYLYIYRCIHSYTRTISSTHTRANSSLYDRQTSQQWQCKNWRNRQNVNNFRSRQSVWKVAVAGAKQKRKPDANKIINFIQNWQAGLAAASYW